MVVVYLSLTLSALEQILLDYDGVNRSIIRSGYLIVTGGMLAYFGAFRERSRTRLAMLVAWPGPKPASGTVAPIASALAHVAEVMQVPRDRPLLGGPV